MRWVVPGLEETDGAERRVGLGVEVRWDNMKRVALGVEKSDRTERRVGLGEQ